MDRHRSDRFDDRSGDRFGEGGGRRLPSRWSSDSPTERHPRYPRGGAGGGGDGGRYHPYRGSQDLPAPPGGGFRGGDPGGFSPPVSVGGPRRGFSGRSGSPGKLKGPLFSFRIFYHHNLLLVPQIRPLFEVHGDVIEVAFIKDRKTGEQQGLL
ncbi:hypothetical protein B296_00021472 [Ensete ventricosum]|uniref:RRM domain-containing protein n=1 Tax=Ensete ventricosum TaxID=4639 RepID=A0A427AZI4_ENSVE|nr:hypothetical protein B296_00021472 [Ensete ventricosum]